MHNQPPKSPLSGGLHEASLREATDERPHIYIVRQRCPAYRVGIENSGAWAKTEK